MFRHEGRSDRHDQRLAGYLALVAGFVNSAGFVLVGSFTSHVTGSVGRFADDVAVGDGGAAFAALMIVAFFSGAFLASMAIESNAVRHRPLTYGGLLLVEALLLATFAGGSYVMDTGSARMHDVQAMLLCAAMGLQNSLVTRLSGAVVRTTHLTGVVTDLGIESARWFRLWRGRVGRLAHVRLVTGSSEPLAPQGPKTRLLLTIFIGFVGGGVLGALLATRFGRIAIALPTFSLLVGGLGAMRGCRTLDTPRA